MKYPAYAQFTMDHDDICLETSSFSDVSRKDLDHLGVSFSTKQKSAFIATVNELMEGISVQGRKLSDRFKEFWMLEGPSIVRTMQSKMEFWGRPSEALARSLSNDLVSQVCSFLKTGLGCTPRTLVELTLSNLEDPSIITNWKKKTALGLTGRLDYMLLTIMHPKVLAEKRGIQEADLLEGLNKIRLQSSLDAVLSLPGISQVKDDPDCCRFNMVEAKKLSLEQHEPQTVAMNLVAMQKVGRTMMPWCITNGSGYLFGLVQARVESYHSSRLDTAITFDEAVNPVDLETIMKVLIFWVYAPDEKINLSLDPK